MSVNDIKKNIEVILSSGFFRNFLILVSGSAAAQIINLSASPIITRLFEPYEFGVFSSYSSILTLIACIVGFSLPMTIVMAKGEREAVSITHVAICICIIVIPVYMTLSYVSIICFEIFEAIRNDRILIFLAAISIILNFFVEVFTYWGIRKGKFKSQSKGYLYKSIAVSIFKICFGFISPNAESLIIAVIIGTGVQLWVLSQNVEVNRIFRLPSKYKSNIYPYVIFKYKDIIVYRTMQNLISCVNATLPLILISSVLGPTYTGFYSLTKTVLYLPITIIGKAVNDIFYQKLTVSYNNRKPIFKKVFYPTILLALMGSIPFIIIYVWGGVLFEFVFGENWIKAGIYASLLTPWLFLNFINRTCVACISILKLEKTMFINSLINMFFILSLFYFAKVNIWDDVATINYFGWVSVIPQMVILIFALYKARVNDKKLGK